MRPWFCTIGVLACVSVGLGAQAPPPQGAPATSPAASPRRFVALGCVRSETAAAARGRGTAAAAPRYLLTDLRGDAPKVYVLEGDQETLALHVGHTVEVAGPLSPAPAGTEPANALVMKVTALTYLSRTCVLK